MSDFFEKYGYCEVPKGTLLYRGHAPRYQNDIFFGTKYSTVTSYGNGVEIWKSKKNFKVIFLIRHLDTGGRAISSIADIYYDLYPEATERNLIDLDIKQVVHRRIPFVKCLFDKHNLAGWFSSIEDTEDTEICLFDNQNIDELMELVGTSSDRKKYQEDSLKKLRLYPSSDFFLATKDSISKSEGVQYDQKKQYENYKKRIEIFIKEGIEAGSNRTEMKRYYYNLRFKFKI